MEGCQEVFKDLWNNFTLCCDLEKDHIDYYHHDMLRGLHWRAEDDASLVPAVPSS